MKKRSRKTDLEEVKNVHRMPQKWQGRQDRHTNRNDEELMKDMKEINDDQKIYISQEPITR